MFRDTRRLVMIVLFGVLFVFMVACSTDPVSDQASKPPTSTPIVLDEAPIPIPSSPVTTVPSPAPQLAPGKSVVPPAPAQTGKAILVSLSQQWLYAYEDGALVFDHAVETGRPELPTPIGTFTVLEKVRDVMFTSP